MTRSSPDASSLRRESPVTPDSERGRPRAPRNLTLQVPPRIPIIFPSDTASLRETAHSSEPSSPTSPPRQRTIRFKSRVRIGSLRHSFRGPSTTDRSPESTPGLQSATNSAPISARSNSGDDDDGSDSDSSSILVPLHESRPSLPMPSPMPPSTPAQSSPVTIIAPKLPQPESDQHAYLVLGPSYGWSEHTPLLPKQLLLPPSGPRTSHRRYNSDPRLNNAALARAQAAAKRTEEDVWFEHMPGNPYLSVQASTLPSGCPVWSLTICFQQWWWWKLRHECCCCVVEDDEDDGYY